MPYVLLLLRPVIHLFMHRVAWQAAAPRAS